MVNRLTIPRLGVPNLPLRQLGRVGMFWWFWYVFQEVFFMIICIHVSCIHLSSIVGPKEKTTAESHRIQTTLGVDSVPAAPPFRQVFCQRLKGLDLEEGKHWHYVDAEDLQPQGWCCAGLSFDRHQSQSPWRCHLGVGTFRGRHLRIDEIWWLSSFSKSFEGIPHLLWHFVREWWVLQDEWVGNDLALENVGKLGFTLRRRVIDIWWNSMEPVYLDTEPQNTSKFAGGC